MVGKQIDLSTTKPVLSIAEGKWKIYLGFSWCCRVYLVFFLKLMPVGFSARKSTLALRGVGAAACCRETALRAASEIFT